MTFCEGAILRETLMAVILCNYTYDSQGRRFEKKVTVAGTATLHHRYIYRGYLQIAALDLTRSAHPALWLVTWDPSQPTATRPLAIQKDGTWFTYGYDLTKNICEVFGPAGYIRTAYAYAPFGAVTASGDVSQPFQWSSEHYDSELDLVYYNYRHYSPSLGRFLSRDPIEEQGGINLYLFIFNQLMNVDARGLSVLDNFKDAIKFFFLPGTAEVSIPIGGTGLGIFINIVFKRPQNFRQDIEIAGGANWDVRGKVISLFKKIPYVGNKLLPYIEKIPSITASLWISGKGSHGCTCDDVCEFALNGAITAGSGRRGTSFPANSSHSLRANSSFSGGISGERSGVLNVCDGTISLDYTLVASLNVNVGFENWRFSYNRDFETEGSIFSTKASKNPWFLFEQSFDSLKWFTPCK